MARAKGSNAGAVRTGQSEPNITIDLTDSNHSAASGASADAVPRVAITIPEANPLRPAVGVPEGSAGLGGEFVDHGRLTAELALPAFILGDSRSEASGAGAAGPVYRALDIVLAGVLLLVLTPLMLMAAVAIKLDTTGPVFYRHQRIGRNGRKLGVIKFRSMVVNADRRIEEARDAVAAQNGTVVDAPTFKSADDPRVTRVGRFLRRSGIDEIPQLFNVMVGQMSVVGPRPLVEDEVAMLSPQEAKLRHMVRPGITCLWQVFRSAETSFSERMHLDLLYVKQRSFRLYLTLVVITPLALFRGRGAY